MNVYFDIMKEFKTMYYEHKTIYKLFRDDNETKDISFDEAIPHLNKYFPDLDTNKDPRGQVDVYGWYKYTWFTIVNDKYPKYSFAFKMVLSDQMAESIVTDVIWTPSKDGLLKPRVQYEPVIIGDSTLEFATAHNADFIRKNKIGIGAVIQIIKSGDVIPKIQKVITPAETAKMPTIPYKWNKTHKDAIMMNPQKNSIEPFKRLGDDTYLQLDNYENCPVNLN